MKRRERAALELGVSIVSAKLAAAMGLPGSMPMAPMNLMPQPMAQSAMQPAPQPGPQVAAPMLQRPNAATLDSVDPASESDAELPTTNEQIRDRSAKIAPGRVISTS